MQQQQQQFQNAFFSIWTFSSAVVLFFWSFVFLSVSLWSLCLPCFCRCFSLLAIAGPKRCQETACPDNQRCDSAYLLNLAYLSNSVQLRDPVYRDLAYLLDWGSCGTLAYFMTLAYLRDMAYMRVLAYLRDMAYLRDLAYLRDGGSCGTLANYVALASSVTLSTSPLHYSTYSTSQPVVPTWA